MGVVGALSLVGAAVSAFGSIQEGQAQKATAEANAQIYEKQARNIAEAQKITAGQYRSRANILRGQATATAARNGVKISGSTANSISQSIMQLQMDNSYEQFNLEMKKYEATSNAAMQKFQGKQAAKSGYMKAASTALEAGANYYDKYWKGSSAQTWFNGQKNKVMSWNNTKLSGGLPTTNKQMLNNNSGTYIA